MFLSLQLEHIQSAGMEMKELLEDDRFLDWYFKKDEASVAAWQDLLQAHPEWLQAQTEAVAFLDRLEGMDMPVSANRLAVAEARLANMLAASRSTTPVVGLKRAKSWLVWSVAASLLLAVAGTWFYRQQAGTTGEELQLAASFGEISNAGLPDGSDVVLNANSRIRYQKNFEQAAVREVWLEGEAFFHVKKTANRKKFIVHTHQFDVLVTGTQFNVVTRGKQARVYLQEGGITLLLPNGARHQMKPNDFVVLEGNRIVESTRAEQKSITAWKERMIALDATSMARIAAIIENDYGVKVQLADDLTAQQMLGPGLLPNSSLETLLETLRSTGNFAIDQKADTVHIRFIGQ